MAAAAERDQPQEAVAVGAGLVVAVAREQPAEDLPRRRRVAAVLGPPQRADRELGGAALVAQVEQAPEEIAFAAVGGALQDEGDALVERRGVEACAGMVGEQRRQQRSIVVVGARVLV